MTKISSRMGPSWSPVRERTRIPPRRGPSVSLCAVSDGAGPGDDVDVPVTPEDIERAARRIEAHVRRTPVIEHEGLWLKLELLQHAGSFKARGAFNRMLS